ncbi:MAG: 30S ribosomal protein S13, partial [Candidatus Lokiarchaeota archaeon]|nr:30S ribosomal protein S13 [Candidatus Lokiarchaeota archaeon]
MAQETIIKQKTFKEIIRILRTNIDGTLPIRFGLVKIKGVGLRFSQAVLRIANIDPTIRIGLISEKDIKRIEEIIEDPIKNGIPNWMVNRQKDLRTGEYLHITGPRLELTVKRDIERMRRLRSWKGYRHGFGLKVRGQRTRSTGR